jgi:hypothetical protein
MSAEALFLADGDLGVFATELARGPWDPSAQHGGAPAALAMRAFEALPAPEELNLARVTYEFLRPVPLGHLVLSASVLRAGRRVRLLEASILSPNGHEVVRARALQIRRAEAVQPSVPLPAPPGPDRAEPGDFAPVQRPMFATDAMELRFVAGGFYALGPSTCWFRFRVPLVAGEPTSALQTLAAAADFGNGISSIVSWDDHMFINPDLTLYVERPPTGEWICLQAETRIFADGVGIAESVLFDEQGQVGRAIQALLVSRR